MKLVLIHILIATFFLQVGGCGGGSKQQNETADSKEVPLIEPAPESNAAKEEEEKVAVTGSNSATGSSDKRSSADPASSARNVGYELVKQELVAPRLIYNADIQIQVENLESTVKQVKEITQKAGGYYTNETHSGGGGEKSVSFTLRIPQTNFESVINAIEKLASYVQYKGTSSQDVTEQYYDSEIRLKTKRKTLDQYYTILQRTTTIKDILEVQAKINELETEIEGLEGRLRYLSNQVSYSTITLRLFVPVPLDKQKAPDPTDSFGVRIQQSFLWGWRILKEITFFLITIWPLLLITGISLWWYRRWKRKRDLMPKKEAKSADDDSSEDESATEETP